MLGTLSTDDDEECGRPPEAIRTTGTLLRMPASLFTYCRGRENLRFAVQQGT